MKLGHDTLMGAVLVIAALLTIGYAARGERAVRAAAVVGAIATFVIGVLLFFSLA